MLKHAFTLQYGLDWGGETRFKAALKPLTIGAELDALAEIEALGDLPDNAAESQKTRRQVQETLIYWARQLEVDGIPAADLTADYLLANLSGADYAQILDEQDALRAKSSAASATETDGAAQTHNAAGKPATKTTAAP